MGDVYRIAFGAHGRASPRACKPSLSSQLRFSLGTLPPGALVVTAELSLWYDETCVAPRRTSRPCDGRGFDVDAHPIFTPRWFAEREVEFGPVAARAVLDPIAPPG
jgi:hypothetical protein